MNKLDSPQDNLQDYFDDLLLAPEPEPAPAPKPQPQPKRQSKPVAVVPSPQFAEPPPAAPARRARLEQLLKTVREKTATATAPSEKTAVESPKPSVKTSVVTDEVASPVAAPAVVASPVVTPEKVTATESQPQVQTAAVAETAVQTKSRLVTPSAAPKTVPAPSETPEVEADADVAVAQSAEVDYGIEGLAWDDNGKPQWAQERFEVLLFKVSGLTLAVPLIALGQIQPITDELTPLFGQADWFMGLQPTPVGKIRTVNTAKFVMPERYDERFVETAQYVISINGLPWGLAVDSVTQPITLNPEDVKWRTERSRRAWLAGTVKEHMCALLDIPMMGQMLMKTDKNLQPGAAG